MNDKQDIAGTIRNFRTRCHICGRLSSRQKPCQRDHSNMMERYYERMEEGAQHEEYMRMSDILAKHARGCDCQGCLTW